MLLTVRPSHEDVRGSPRGENSVFVYDLHVGRDSSVGIATRYGLDGLGIESRYGRDFPHPSRPALVPTQRPLYKGYRVSFRGGKADRMWR